jgi:hypothetical protein
MSMKWDVHSWEMLKKMHESGHVELLGASVWLFKVLGTRTTIGGPNILGGSITTAPCNTMISTLNWTRVKAWTNIIHYLGPIVWVLVTHHSEWVHASIPSEHKSYCPPISKTTTVGTPSRSLSVQIKQTQGRRTLSVQDVKEEKLGRSQQEKAKSDSTSSPPWIPGPVCTKTDTHDASKLRLGWALYEWKDKEIIFLTQLGCFLTGYLRRTPMNF